MPVKGRRDYKSQIPLVEVSNWSTSAVPWQGVHIYKNNMTTSCPGIPVRLRTSKRADRTSTRADRTSK